MVFHGLDKGNIANIAKILLKNLSDRLAKVDMQLEVSDVTLYGRPLLLEGNIEDIFAENGFIVVKDAEYDHQSATQK